MNITYNQSRQSTGSKPCSRKGLFRFRELRFMAGLQTIPPLFLDHLLHPFPAPAKLADLITAPPRWSGAQNQDPRNPQRALRPAINNHHQPNPVDKWYALIGDPNYANAILDRIVHNAHRINLTGHSLRRD
jgi:hypothetical protein